MKTLSPGLDGKAESLLHFYGGLEGFAKNPPWLIAIVLRTWFTASERNEIVEFMFRGLKSESRLPIKKEIGTR